MKSSNLLPRVIRFRDAPFYLGMDRGRFNAEVRPLLTEFRIGKQGIGFDRLDLDAWLDDYKRCNERPASDKQGAKSWDVKEVRGFGFARESGISKNGFSAERFTKALAQATSKKPS